MLLWQDGPKRTAGVVPVDGRRPHSLEVRALTVTPQYTTGGKQQRATA